MVLYFIIFIISYFLCFFDFIKESKIKLLVFVLFTLFVTIIAGFRTVGVDNDSEAYNQIFIGSENISFLQIIKGDYWENTERGYLLLNKLVLSLGGSVTTLFLIVAIVTGFLNYSIIYKISPYPFLSLLFYLSFFYLYRDFTQIRYGLSCGLVFYAIYYFINRRFFLFSLFLISSFFFHNTSYILLLILPFCYFVKDKLVYFFLPVLGLVGFFYNILPLLISQGIGGGHMEIYLGAEGGAGLMIPFVGLVVMLIYIFNEKKLLVNDITSDQYRIFFQFFSISVTLNFLFMQISIFQRFSYLFFQFGILLLPMMLYDLQKNRYKIYFKLLYFLFASFFLYYGLRMINLSIIRPYFS